MNKTVEHEAVAIGGTADIDETSRLGDFGVALVGLTRSGAHVLAHQSGLLMLKDVAMIHERVFARCRLIEGDEKLRLVLDKHNVFPARKMRRRRRSRDG
jgi:hypothetical protein